MANPLSTSMVLAAIPLLAGAAVAAVCHPVNHHHAAHVFRAQKAAEHHIAGLGVVVDQARLVSFSKPVKTVLVGNPTIVDISMLDSQHAFVLGKTFGVTNMIALGADGEQVSEQQVTVLNNGAAVTVNRGADQFNYMCTSAHCETAPRPGDPQPFVANTEGVTTTHEANAGTNAAAASAQSASN